MDIGGQQRQRGSTGSSSSWFPMKSSMQSSLCWKSTNHKRSEASKPSNEQKPAPSHDLLPKQNERTSSTILYPVGQLYGPPPPPPPPPRRKIQRREDNSATRNYRTEDNWRIPPSLPRQNHLASVSSLNSSRLMIPAGLQSVGPPHLGILKGRLPPSLLGQLPLIIDAMEAYTKTLACGWKTGLYSLTKQDVSCRQAGILNTPMVKDVYSYLLHIIRQVTASCGNSKSSSAPITLDKNQPHVVKYNHESRGVGLHHDKSHVTVNLMLSHSHEYTGGG